ncbi:MAG: pyruvate, phosphate dikinase, partial [Candidatus Zophobacter franzmannii]|nr:pyruvate, phosphate dikinase [Candidatus Zophobacter franzmannii]
WDQLWGAVFAVFGSWDTDRAIYYRNMNSIPGEWGTAVNVQAMVYGNMGSNSATGVAFTRDAGTGENIFNGEYLIDAQGEDVVAGIRTPQEITLEGSQRWSKLAGVTEEDRKANFPSLEEAMPVVYKELFTIQDNLEKHYKDMQDLEFTVQDGKLWILQTRNGKRTGGAMVRMAIEMLEEKFIDSKTALLRVEPAKLDELLHPVFEKEAIANANEIAKGLPASPGAATGKIIFFSDEAETLVKKNADEKLILVRIETSPEDLAGMNTAQGILTARGGMTSHAAVVARGMGKCCVSGVATIDINYKARTMTVDGVVYKEGDWISLNGSTGKVYEGKVATINPKISGNFSKLMDLTNEFTKMYVRTNADSPHDAEVARNFGAQGIGLCRTEHMFFDGERIKAMREMILADDIEGREKALVKILPYQRSDFEGIFKAMTGFGVTVRLLDPPLHEFVPHNEKSQKIMADEMGISLADVQKKVEDLTESNPMLGHRGCRLGNTYPEITKMQVRAILEAALNVKAQGFDPRPEIMVPLVGVYQELKMQSELIKETAEAVFAERGERIDYMIGTMIEIPRAALTADEVAKYAEFFSFGTNDLTQMTYGYSRADYGTFKDVYLDAKILEADPFERLDQSGVGQLVEMATLKGRKTKPGLKVGICGEHGGEPNSVEFCHRTGLNYVSCSPYRVPIARLAAAQAAAKEL